MAQNLAQRTPSEYENAQEANKKYFSSGSGQSKFCENFLKELNEKCEEAQVTTVEVGNPNKRWTVEAVTVHMSSVVITGLSSGAFIRVMQQIIQAIKEKHDELQIRHRSKGFQLTIVNVEYISDPLVHHCKHQVWKDGQPGNFEYTDLKTYKYINPRISEISEIISDSGVAKVLRVAGCSGKIITGDLVGETLTTSASNQISAENAGFTIIIILVKKIFLYIIIL
jgi:hypothetical protein